MLFDNTCYFSEYVSEGTGCISGETQCGDGILETNLGIAGCCYKAGCKASCGTADGGRRGAVTDGLVRS